MARSSIERAVFCYGPLLAAALLTGACGGEETQGGVTPIPEAQPLTVRKVEWNPTGAPLDRVAAVAELGGTTAVLADTGATVFSGGVVTAEDGAVTGFKTAAVIPAADGNGMWIAAIDGTGKVLRLRAGSYFEGVSDLYGLEGEAVSGFAALGGPAVAFALDKEIAVSDGATVTRYDIDAAAGIAGGSGRAASAQADAGKVSVFKASTAQAITYDLPGAEQAAFDAAGRLVVRTADSIYIEDGAGGLALRYTGAMGPLRELAASDVFVWFVEGSELSALGAASVLRTTGAEIAEDARLIGSPSGDVWVLGEGEGALERFAAETGDSEGRAVWEKDVQPIYLKSCTPCHEPNGSAGADLSTYGGWVARRDKIAQKVVTEKSMPPAGVEFSDAERAAIAGWIDLKQ